ncbi:glycosyltransferase [Clostridium sp.]|uniref:glycosyltransferase n=1 Tax=Clostridium sp. TaxID=1506 RepID=UPI001D6DA2CE|nr:glycosyltransferase [Clostridium sp.]MBS5937913.1 glycosyltransferase [Clostridium sp.]
MDKKIFFVLNRLGGEGWGGAHRVAIILANYLSKKKYDVSIIVWQKSPIDYPIDDDIELICFNFDKINEKNRILACFKMRNIFKQFKGAYVYAFMSRIAIDVFLSALFLKFKIIASERTDPNREPKKLIFRLIRNMFFCFMYKTVYQTNDAKSYFPKLAQKKGYVIPNPISPSLPQPYMGKRKKEFVTFCRIDEQKNLYLMINSFIKVHKKYKDFVLKIYGNGIIENQIKQYIYENNAEEFIILYGFTKDIHNIILDSYAYLSTSDYEGMSNSMLEALAIGLPSICTDCPIGGARTIIKNEVNGILIPVGNEDQLTMSMIRLIENEDLCYKLSKNALKVREQLSEEKICSKWERLMY